MNNLLIKSRFNPLFNIELFIVWKHNFQNVLYCINKLVLHNNPYDIITIGSIIPHLKDKEARAQKGYVSYPRSKSIVEF